MKQWLDVSYADMVNYLVFSEGNDGGELQLELPAQ